MDSIHARDTYRVEMCSCRHRPQSASSDQQSRRRPGMQGALGRGRRDMSPVLHGQS